VSHPVPKIKKVYCRMATIAFSCADGIYKVVKLIQEHQEIMGSNNAISKRILKNVEDLKKFSVELKNLDKNDISEVVKENLTNVKDTLEIITAKCTSIQVKGSLKRLAFAKSETTELGDLHKSVQHARDSLQIALQLASYNQGKEIKEDVKRGNQVVRNVVHHSEAGLYLNPTESRPHAVKRLNVALVPEGDLAEISWIDDENACGSVVRYELYFDDETGKNLPLLASKITARGKECSVRLGDPLIVAGNVYTIKLRAVNGSGPGEWSESASFRFKTGPPAQPKKPVITVTSTTEVKIEVQKLKPNEERGSPVTHCVIEYVEMKEDNEIECQWKASTLALKRKSQDADSHNFNVGSLKPNTKYRFRVKMQNCNGTSAASEFYEIITDCLIPGPPQNVRISSKRLPTALKVRWSKPSHNPDGVSQYKVQYRIPKDIEWIHIETTNPTKNSSKVTDLKTDQEYEFRIQALNQNNEGHVSEPVIGETRFGAFGRALLSAGAGVGGTIGGPLLGGVMIGHVASSSAKQSADSTAGKRAAGAAAAIGGGIGGAILGLIGAPILGISAAIVANQQLKGNLDSSPQTSDDESENDTLLDKIMKQSKENIDTYWEDNKRKSN